MVANCKQYLESLAQNEFDLQLTEWYGKSSLEQQKERYEQLLRKAVDTLENKPVFIATSPGRTELGGNHTDHNNGMVLAGAIDRDCLAVIYPNDNNEVEIVSEGFKPILVDLKNLKVETKEYGTPEAIVRGTAAGLQNEGFTINGFKALISTNIPIGCGLSSSASLEVLIGSIFAKLAKQGLTPKQNAIIGQQTENKYFGKPCGLMDQMTCAERGIIHIDFNDHKSPIVNKIDTNFQNYGHQLVIVNSGGDHRDLTDEYSSITDEMSIIAKLLGQSHGRGLTSKNILDNLPLLRKEGGDRAVLRMLHFITENDRVGEMVKALKNKEFSYYLKLVRESGKSSWQLLQNCFPTGAINQQPISLALTISDLFLNGKGASRVHGGGFAGTIQAYVPSDTVDSYCQFMGNYFGEDNVFPIRIRPQGNEFIEL
ncbi:MAG: hypothetical protein OCC45_09520 [Desulfotalea sp.]